MDCPCSFNNSKKFGGSCISQRSYCPSVWHANSLYLLKKYQLTLIFWTLKSTAIAFCTAIAMIYFNTNLVYWNFAKKICVKVWSRVIRKKKGMVKILLKHIIIGKIWGDEKCELSFYLNLVLVIIIYSGPDYLPK